MQKKKGNKGPKLDLKSITYEDMIKIPQDETELPEVPVCINMERKVRVDQLVKVTDIKHHALQLVFERLEEEAEPVLFKLGMDSKWEHGFQFDLLMAFWLSVHMGNRQLLNRIMIYDVYLRQLVTLALKGQKERPADWSKPKV